MGKKVKKLISDCVSQRDSSFRLFEESRIITEDSSKFRTSVNRNMELVDKVTDYIYDTVITGGLELVYLLREKWVDEDNTLSEEDSSIVIKAFEDIDEFIKVCSKEFLNLKVLRDYTLSTDLDKIEDQSRNIFDRNTISSLSTIMVDMIKPIGSISRARGHIIEMGKEKYGAAQK